MPRILPRASQTLSLSLGTLSLGAALLAGTGPALAVADVMQPLSGTLVVGTLVTFGNNTAINGLNRGQNGLFDNRQRVVGNPDGTGPNPAETSRVRLREAMAAYLLDDTGGVPGAAVCTQPDQTATCVGGAVNQFRQNALGQQGAGATPDVAATAGVGVARSIKIAEGKPGATIHNAVQQLQDFRRLAASLAVPYAMPASGQLIVTEDKVRTTGNNGLAVGPRTLDGQEHPCILYHAEAVQGNAQAARFAAAQQGDDADTGPAVSRLTDQQAPEPRPYAIFFLRPSALAPDAQTQVDYGNICKTVAGQNLGNNEHVVVYKANQTWYYAQTGAAWP